VAPEELDISSAGLRDPIGDLDRRAAPRLTHRYPDRALLHVTNLCPMYCRFCFRKNLMNERDENLYGGSFAEAFAYLAEHPEIEELILTGGDPWMLSDEKLAALVDEIAADAGHSAFESDLRSSSRDSAPGALSLDRGDSLQSSARARGRG
jgi:lysine 2,3-aminomutase